MELRREGGMAEGSEGKARGRRKTGRERQKVIRWSQGEKELRKDRGTQEKNKKKKERSGKRMEEWRE